MVGVAVGRADFAKRKPLASLETLRAAARVRRHTTDGLVTSTQNASHCCFVGRPSWSSIGADRCVVARNVGLTSGAIRNADDCGGIGARLIPVA
jgi:hypothetical protein